MADDDRTMLFEELPAAATKTVSPVMVEIRFFGIHA
jgi:hypothetical protein